MSPTDPRLAYTGLPILIWTAGPDGSCDYLSERWTECTGRPVADLLGWGWSEQLHPDDRESVVADYGRAVAERVPVRLEFRMRHQDGDYRWYLGVGEPRFGSDGEFLGYSGCTTDVTRERELEQRMAKLGGGGEVAQLAGGIAHEFTNLLTGILGHVTLLMDDETLSAEARQDLLQIQQAAGRAATLSRQLLAFSQRPLPTPRFLDLNELVSGTVNAIRQVVGPLVEVVQEHANEPQPVLVGPGQVEQILLQLATRAHRAMPGGGTLRLRTGRVTVDEPAARSSPDLRPRAYVTLEVSDTGPPIESEALGRVFDPPTAAIRAADPSLDLSLVAGIAKLSGGHAAVASEAGVGTTFTVYLPRLTTVVDDQTADDAGFQYGTETILLVEDDVQVREVGRRALERSGYTVLAAGDSEAAIAAADRHPGHIHLLITDVDLPRVSGRELAARLGIHRPAIKVLYVSGTSDGAVTRHRMLEPGTEFLEKPYSLDPFLRKVRQILGTALPAEDLTAWDQRSPV
jgi:PAS domain S-box-containing protein